MFISEFLGNQIPIRERYLTRPSKFILKQRLVAPHSSAISTSFSKRSKFARSSSSVTESRSSVKDSRQAEISVVVGSWLNPNQRLGKSTCGRSLRSYTIALRFCWSRISRPLSMFSSCVLLLSSKVLMCVKHA